jgi:hypothetical protein
MLKSSIHELNKWTVSNKTKNQAFAANLNQQHIVWSAQELNMPPHDAELLVALQSADERLGLIGSHTPHA